MSMTSKRLLLVILIGILPSACKSVGEFPAPRGGAEISFKSEDVLTAFYSDVVKHIEKMGFELTPLPPPSPGMKAMGIDYEHSLFGGGPSAYFRQYKMIESNGYVLTLEIDASHEKLQVVEQYSEVTQGSTFKNPPVFSPIARSTLDGFDEYLKGISSTHSVTVDEWRNN